MCSHIYLFNRYLPVMVDNLKFKPLKTVWHLTVPPPYLFLKAFCLK